MERKYAAAVGEEEAGGGGEEERVEWIGGVERGSGEKSG